MTMTVLHVTGNMFQRRNDKTDVCSHLKTFLIMGFQMLHVHKTFTRTFVINI